MIYQSIKMAIKSILSNKMRSFLTMLGVIIGVFSLVVLVSLVSGASGKITGAINELGTDQIDVYITATEGRPITLNELMTDIKGLPGIENVAPQEFSAGICSSRTESEKSIIFGTTPALPLVTNVKLESGRFLMNPDMDNHSNVIVLSHELAVDVMGRADVVGETIRVNGREYTIIGITEKQNNAMMALLMGTNYRAYIPFTTMTRAFPSTSGMTVSDFIASPVDGDFARAEEELNTYLLKRYNNDEDAFSVYNESTISDQMGTITGALSILFGGIAGISLLVGGIGIMNIMLVSVTERTREIGIRKSLGARTKDILTQFLIEAMILSLIGGIIGTALGIGIAAIGMTIAKVRLVINPLTVIIAVVFSAGVGLLFGVFPAKKAARLDPIEALRYE